MSAYIGPISEAQSCGSALLQTLAKELTRKAYR